MLDYAAGISRRRIAPAIGAIGNSWPTGGGQVIHYQTAVTLDARARDARDIGMQWLALFSLGREPGAFWSHLPTARPAGSSAWLTRASSSVGS